MLLLNSSTKAAVNKEEDNLFLMIDEDMQHLYELTTKMKKNENDIGAIISILQEKVPLLLDGLPIFSQHKIAQCCNLKIYYKDEVVFHQGEEPNSYYTVIHGAVSIYAKKSCQESAVYNHYDKTISSILDERIKQYGQYLTQIVRGTSFGELSFNEDGKHSRRNATVVSDGNLDLNDQVQIISRDSNYHDEDKNREMTVSPNYSILLLIPEEVYMTELYKRHEFKHQTKHKISFLKNSILFQNFAYDDIVKISYSMNEKHFPKGSIIARQGDRTDSIVMVQKGTILIYQKIVKATKRSNTSSSSNSNSVIASVGKDQCGGDVVIDIAKIGSHDVFGIVEAVTKSKKMKREAVASTDVGAFLIQVSTFLALFQKEPTSMKILRKIVDNRLKWEILRQDFAMRFSSSMPLSLPKNANELSNYALVQHHASGGGNKKNKSKKESKK